MSEQNNSSLFAEKYGRRESFTSSKVDKSGLEESVSVIDNQGQITKKAVDPQKRALAQYIYLVRGVDAGRNAWYYVLVERLKVQLFLKALNDDIIHLEKYGKILYSAYGDEPPANVTQVIKDEYGIS
jgi:hypothetical protein